MNSEATPMLTRGNLRLAIEDEATAALIVRAVNSHDDLVEALRTLVSLVEMDPDFIDPSEADSYAALQNARAALVKAGER